MPQDYNMLRHGGTIYSLTMSYNNLKSDPAIRDTVVRASKFLQAELLPVKNPKKSDQNMTAVFSRAELEGINNTKAKLGGTGLGLLALVNVEKIVPGTTDGKILRQMGNFLEFMQRKDGGFDSFYVPKKGKTNRKPSLFYPGEAAYGLTMLYELNKEAKWLNIALKSVGYLAKVRKRLTTVEMDHWALLASQRLLKNYGHSDKSVPKTVIEKHAKKVIRSMMQNLESTPLEHTSHRATCMEGMIAMREVVSKGSKEKFENIVEKSIKFLMDIQIKSGKYKGGIPANGNKKNPRSTELRIDHNQHAMSAMIQFMNSYL